MVLVPDAVQPVDPQRIYTDTRRQIVALVSGLDDAKAETTVAACPDWTIIDLVAHLAGVLGDILAGNIEGAATDPWTQEQVAARKGTPLPELLDEWERHAATVEPMIGSFPARGASMLCADIYNHEQDVRSTLGEPGNREGTPFDHALEMGAQSLVARLEEQGASLRIRADGREWTAGDAPAVTVEADPFDLMRALYGRRSTDQIRAFTWSGDPEPFLGSFALFTPRAEPLVE